MKNTIICCCVFKNVLSLDIFCCAMHFLKFFVKGAKPVCRTDLSFPNIFFSFYVKTKKKIKIVFCQFSLLRGGGNVEWHNQESFNFP